MLIYLALASAILSGIGALNILMVDAFYQVPARAFWRDLAMMLGGGAAYLAFALTGGN